eukprot:sb/3470444/
MNVLPWYHCYGFTQMSVCFDAGIDVWLFNKFDPEIFLKSIEESRTDFLAIVPPLVIFLAKHPMVSNYDLSTVKDIISAAAPLSQEVIEETMARLPNLKHIRQAELEGVLASHPAIGDAAVIGIPHEKFGEVPKAFITPAPGVTITVDEVKEIISSRLSAEKALGEFYRGILFKPQINQREKTGEFIVFFNDLLRVIMFIVWSLIS